MSLVNNDQTGTQPHSVDLVPFDAEAAPVFGANQIGSGH